MTPESNLLPALRLLAFALLTIASTGATAAPDHPALARGVPQALTGQGSGGQVGAWVGSFQVSVMGGGEAPRPPISSAGVLEIQENGAVVLHVEALRCQGSGRTLQNLSRSFVALDLVFAGCPYSILNQRFTGHMTTTGNAGEMRIGPADRAATPKVHISARVAR